MCWKPRDNNRLSQSKEGIKHQSCLLKSFGYYGKSIKSVWKARHAIRQPSTPPAQHSHIPAIHSTLWWGAHPDSTGRALTGHASPCTVPCPLSSAVVPAQWGHPQPPPGTNLPCCRASWSWNTHRMCLQLWSNSQTSAELVSFPNYLKAESKDVFK